MTTADEVSAVDFTVDRPQTFPADSPDGPRVGAFFDVDGTLVSGYTAAVHARHRLRNRQSSIGELLGIAEAAVRYRLGRMKFERLLVRAGGFMRGDSLDDLDRLAVELFDNGIAARVFPVMRQIVADHQRRGHTVVLSTSALTIHVQPLARSLGIDHVICNHFAVDHDGVLTGDIVRPIVWGRNKAAAVHAFSAANDVDLQLSYFYTDGEEDLPLMREVGHPVPVNPRNALASEADEQGWTVVYTVPRTGPVRSLWRKVSGRR